MLDGQSKSGMGPILLTIEIRLCKVGLNVYRATKMCLPLISSSILRSQITLANYM